MTVPKGQAATAELIDLLDKQLNIYQRLRQLSGQQSRLIADQSPEALMSLLAQRQELIDQLVDISAQVEPYRAHWPEFWSHLADATRQDVRGRIDAVRSELDAVIAQDERDRKALAAGRDAVSNSLKHVRLGTAAGRAYGASTTAAPSPRFTDREG